MAIWNAPSLNGRSSAFGDRVTLREHHDRKVRHGAFARTRGPSPSRCLGRRDEWRYPPPIRMSGPIEQVRGRALPFRSNACPRGETKREKDVGDRFMVGHHERKPRVPMSAGASPAQPRTSRFGVSCVCGLSPTSESTGRGRAAPSSLRCRKNESAMIGYQAARHAPIRRRCRSPEGRCALPRSRTGGNDRPSGICQQARSRANSLGERGA